MILDSNKVLERSVDSMAKIYAIVIGLALSESVRTLITKNLQGQPNLTPATLESGLPAFVAIVATLVPFWHGMNRHLDRCYLEKNGPVAQGALLLDFITFFIEASLLLIAGWALRDGLVTFYCLGAALLIDSIWGIVSHQIHFPNQKSHVRKWATTNLIAGCVALAIVAFPFNWKPTLLMVIAVGRTIVDYIFGWDFYFPPVPATPLSKTPVPPAADSV